jgi:CubicO group peptidase (beta-lactamase class C family)
MSNRIRTLTLFALLFCLTLLPSRRALATENQADFAAIDAHIVSQMQELRIPGLALGIVKDDQILYLQGYGVADPSGRSVTPQTPFQIASLGKPLTGVAIMQLVEQGKLELDAPVQRYLPWFRVADEVASAQMTVRHLLYHTSGLPQRVGIEIALKGDSRPDALEARVRELKTVQLNRPVGATYEYANSGYMILGLLIQEVSGQSYESYLSEHLFAPLQMNQAFTELDEAKAHGLASGYRQWFGLPLPGEMAVDRAALPSGGHMSASVEDMAHFLIANLNGGRFGDNSILSPEGIAAMHSPVVPIASQLGTGSEYMAMDWGIMPMGDLEVVMKGGDNADYKTNMLLIPSQRLGVVALINTNDPIGTFYGDIGIALIAHNVAELLMGYPLTVVPSSPIPMLLKGGLLLVLAIQLAGMTLTLIRVWRMRSQPAPDVFSQPPSQRTLVTYIGIPFLLNLGWGLFVLVGVPNYLKMPLSFMQYMLPTLGYTLLVSGIVALGWSVIRTVLVFRALGTPGTPTTHLVGAPVSTSPSV